jgi:phytoene dehydrogenase-like protein
VTEEHDVIVVGAGVAGLACARRLLAGGRAALVLERSDAIGGRVRTDFVDGFLLDHGFQVLPVAYPEAKAALDFDRLDLGAFARGAIVRCEGRFRRLTDPRHSPVQGLRSLAGGVVGVRDGAAVLRLLRGSDRETTTAEALRCAGISRATVERFFGPFLRGIFLEERLATSSRFLDFVLRSFSAGPAALPHGGMRAIAAQLGEGLDVRTGAAVVTVGPHAVSLETGEQLRADAVVVATAGIVDEPTHGWNGVTCVYYDAPKAPIPGPWLVVNGEGGLVNNFCVPSEVVPSYACGDQREHPSLNGALASGRRAAGAVLAGAT